MRESYSRRRVPVGRWCPQVGTAFDDDVHNTRQTWARLIGAATADVAIGATVCQLVGLVAL
jgi:hypothetical protein